MIVLHRNKQAIHRREIHPYADRDGWRHELGATNVSVKNEGYVRTMWVRWSATDVLSNLRN